MYAEVVPLAQDVHVRLAVDNEGIGVHALVIELHMQIRVHPRQKHAATGQCTDLLGGVRLEAEGTDHSQVKAPGLFHLSREGNQIVPRDGAKLRTDGDGHAFPPFAFRLLRPSLGLDIASRPRHHLCEGQTVGLVRLAHARAAQKLQHPRDEAFPFTFRMLSHAHRVRCAIGPLHGHERLHGAHALHREGPRHAGLLLVLVRPVVKVLRLSVAGDGGIDFLLPGLAHLLELSLQILRLLGPGGRCLEGHLPLLRRGLTERRTQRFAQFLRGLHVPFVNNVNLRIVGDGFQRDVRHTFVDKALLDASLRGAHDGLARDFPFLLHALLAVCQQVVGKLRRHHAPPRQGQCHTAHVNRHPAPPPLLGHHRCSPAPARRVKHQVSGVSTHQHATRDNLFRCLNHIHLIRGKACNTSVIPDIGVFHH